MIQLRNDIAPAQEVLDQLAAWQKEVLFEKATHREHPFSKQVSEAKRMFGNKNKKDNETFILVKEKLTELCSGAKRCVYCEDSLADEVEHIWPKDFYPEKVFDWENYIYACGPCNGPKNNQFKIRTAEIPEIDLRTWTGGKPPFGESLLVNPRDENGLEYLQLNLYAEQTLLFEVNPTSPDRAKSDWTLQLLGNLTSETVGRSRKEQYEDYKSRLGSYLLNKMNDAPDERLDRMVKNLKSKAHPSVWAEMKRQYRLQPDRLALFDVELKTLFDHAPEALHW